MSHAHEGYDPKCPSCTPCIAGSVPVPAEVEARMLQMWWEEPFEVREAFILVTRNNNHDPHLLELAGRFVNKLNLILQEWLK